MITNAPTSNSSGGYTVIEVVMAMGVFGILATGIMVASISNYKLSYENSYRNSAHDIAQGFINQIRTKSYSNLVGFAAGSNDIVLNKIVTDGITGTQDTITVSDETPFSELVFIGDIRRDGSMSDKTMTMGMTFDVVDVSAATGLSVVEINLNYSFTYSVPGGPPKTYTDSLQIVRAE